MTINSWCMPLQTISGVTFIVGGGVRAHLTLENLLSYIAARNLLARVFGELAIVCTVDPPLSRPLRKNLGNANPDK